jgi:hypothetical protein
VQQALQRHRDLCRGSEVYDAARSASNPAEAQAVRRLVRQLVDQGVPRPDIGIISFFHAQVCWCASRGRVGLSHICAYPGCVASARAI